MLLKKNAHLSSSGLPTWTMLFAMTIALFACKPDPRGANGSNQPNYGTAETDSDSDATTDTDATSEDFPRVSGIVTDADGEPIEDLLVYLIGSDLEYSARTDADGRYEFDIRRTDWMYFSVTAPDGSGLATASTVVYLDDEDLEIDVQLPNLPAGVPLAVDPTEVALGDRLFATLAEGDLNPPIFVAPADSIAGVKAPIHPPVDGAFSTLAVWYLDPHLHEASDASIPVRISGDWGLTGLRLWQVDFPSRTWVDLGPLTETPNGLVGEIPMFDTLALVALQ